MQQQMRKRKRRRPRPNQRFLAMSKLIGVFIAIALSIVVIYAMYEMHTQRDLSSLSQLLISVFGIGAVYIGFYLTMAKWEHTELEKTNRQKDLLKLKKQLELYNPEEQTCEDIDMCNQDIMNLDNRINELDAHDFTNNYY